MGTQRVMMGTTRATTGTKVKVRTTMDMQVKKNSGDNGDATTDNGYATADDGYMVGRRRLMDWATTGRARARTAEIARQQVLSGRRQLRLGDDGSRVG